MKNLLAIGLACCLPIGLAAEDPAPDASPLGDVSVLVLEDSVPAAADIACAPAPGDRADCSAVHRAVLTAHLRKVSALRERGRWM